ncbi:MAG: LLM class flavin-dependent oxidoreductase [Anaerolineaceae bacterium]|nr:LLM class flavin-dependent oxidoreductase [Anaerolineaceae bacterium]
MQYGMSLPNFNDFGSPRVLAQLARDAEDAGWDGFFIWDHMIFNGIPRPFADPWVALAAAAVNTQRIRLGPLLTPLPRRRPWKLARETVSLDHLSGGRLILGAGLGDPVKSEYGYFHEEANIKTLAEKLDEGLEILTGLWQAKPFTFQGKHYQLEEVTFLPAPLQTPRIPIWIGGFWPNKPPFRRAARFDGVCPIGYDHELSPKEWREILAYTLAQRSQPGPFDAVHIGSTSGDPAQDHEIVTPYADAGVTWWIEDISPFRYGLGLDQPWPAEYTEKLKKRIHQGPPRVQ